MATIKINSKCKTCGHIEENKVVEVCILGANGKPTDSIEVSSMPKRLWSVDDYEEAVSIFLAWMKNNVAGGFCDELKKQLNNQD